MYESELIPLFEKCGTIWDLRLMMDPMTGLNRGYAFVTFTTRDAAQEAVRQVEKIFFYKVNGWTERLFFLHLKSTNIWSSTICLFYLTTNWLFKDQRY